MMMTLDSAAADSPQSKDMLKYYKTCQALLEKLCAMHTETIHDNVALQAENSKLQNFVNASGLSEIFLDLPDSRPTQVLPHVMTSKGTTACVNDQRDLDALSFECDRPKNDEEASLDLTSFSLSKWLPPSGGDKPPSYVAGASSGDEHEHSNPTSKDDTHSETSEPCANNDGLEHHRTSLVLGKIGTPLERWQTLVYMLFNPQDLYLRQEAQRDLEFHHVWLISSQGSNFGWYESESAKPYLNRFQSCIHGQYLTSNDLLLQKLVMDPAGHKPMLWGAIGAGFLLYDLVVTPLSFFDLTPDVLQAITDFNKVTLAYWIVDVFVQLCTGIHKNGVVDMRPPQILRNYLRTWFIPDLVIICTDVALLYVTSYVGGASSLRMVRVLRLLRLCRFLRIRRLQSLASLLEMMSVQISSVFIQLVLSLLQHVFVIILINHYIACAWYYISWLSVQDSGYDSSWLRAFGVETSSVEQQYALAFHWSLTQFSPATNNISPANTSERTFACAVVVFAMIVFSSFISNVTSTVNKLNQYNSKKLQEESLIRKFLCERSISTELGSQIMQFFNSNYYRNKTRIHKSDIRIMAELPSRLTRRLDDEMYAAVLLSSSLIGKFIECDQSLVSKLCHDCTSMHTFMSHQDVFVEEVECMSVYYLSGGVSKYLSARYRASTIFQPPKAAPDTVNIGDWLSEMAFWVPWHHRGRLNCATFCEFICLCCAKFAACVSSHGGEVYHSMCVLAIYVVAHIEKGLDDGHVLTDAAIEKDELDKITLHALNFSKNFQSLRSISAI